MASCPAVKARRLLPSITSSSLSSKSCSAPVVWSTKPSKMDPDAPIMTLQPLLYRGELSTTILAIIGAPCTGTILMR